MHSGNLSDVFSFSFLSLLNSFYPMAYPLTLNGGTHHSHDDSKLVSLIADASSTPTPVASERLSSNQDVHYVRCCCCWSFIYIYIHEFELTWGRDGKQSWIVFILRGRDWMLRRLERNKRY